MAPTLSSVEPERTPPWLWFIGAGTAAVLIAAIAAWVVHAPLWFIHAILPTSILVFNLAFDPSPPDLIKEVVLFSLLFGGTFLLYGTAGWLLGHAIQNWRSWRDGHSRQL